MFNEEIEIKNKIKTKVIKIKSKNIKCKPGDEKPWICLRGFLPISFRFVFVFLIPLSAFSHVCHYRRCITQFYPAKSRREGRVWRRELKMGKQL